MLSNSYGAAESDTAYGLKQQQRYNTVKNGPSLYHYSYYLLALPPPLSPSLIYLYRNLWLESVAPGLLSHRLVSTKQKPPAQWVTHPCLKLPMSWYPMASSNVIENAI